MVARTDVHRPSEINPAEYEYVGCEAIKVEGMDDALFMQEQRALIRAHMNRTGGTYSKHAHGGNCHVCGNANAIYTVLFHHVPTNVYIRVGTDCAEKMDCGPEVFRALTRLKNGVAQERATMAGKKKARTTLNAAGLDAAWGVYDGHRVLGYEESFGQPYEEKTIHDIVAKLVHYGNISDKQMAFISKLLTGIADRPQIEAKRAAEKASAADVPVSDKRVTVSGKVVSLKLKDTGFGSTWKMTLLHADGYKLYGSLPKDLEGLANKGDVVEFTAKVEPSKDDPKFGFWSRPTKGKITKQTI